jgi:hypothetical protein
MTTNKKPTAKKSAAKKAPAKKKPAAKKPAAKKPAAKKVAEVKDSASSYFVDSDEFMKAWDAVEEKIDQNIPDKVEVDTTAAKNWLKNLFRKLFK